MTDTAIRDALDRATRHLSAPPDLVAEVRAGGRRRLVHRRTLLSVGLAAVAGGTVAGGWRLGERGLSDRVASPLLDDPTRGDLAGDTRFLDRVLRVWHRRMRDADVDTIGAAHVIWAGTTPAGPAAAVAQRRHPSISGSSDGDVDFAVIGLVEPAADGPAVLPIQALMRNDPLSFCAAMVVGPRRDVLVVVDIGRPVDLSPDFTYGADGRVLRTFRPLEFTDGAAVVRVPAQSPRITLALRRDAGDPEVGAVELANFDMLAYQGRTNIPPADYLERPLPGWQAAWPADAGERRTVQSTWGQGGLARWQDPFSMLRMPEASEWFLWGASPDGRRLVVRTMPHNDDPMRLLVVLGPADGTEPEVRFAGFLDDAALPIRVRLPQRQGVVVAAVGATLRYRTRSADWLPVTGDAALLPDAATAVQVTPPGGKATTVPLD